MKVLVVGSIILISATLSAPLLAADEKNVWMKHNRRTIGVGVFFVVRCGVCLDRLRSVTIVKRNRISLSLPCWKRTPKSIA